MTVENMQIEAIEIERLKAAAYNPRKDLKPGDIEYEKLRRSMEEFGYVEPIVWNSRTGNIVGGHQRFKVLKELGYERIDCVVLDIDDAREKALNVALNKIGGEFDNIKLSGLLRDLIDTGFDSTLTGFDDDEQNQLFASIARAEGKIQEDAFDADKEAERIQDPVSRPGDIWLIGRHRLLCGDSTDIGQVARLMDGTRAHMIFTDPPWNVAYGENKHPNWKQRKIMNDNMSGEEFYAFLFSAFTVMGKVSEPGAMLYCVMSAQEWPNCHRALTETGFHWSSTIIWYKDSFVLSQKDYHTQFEPIFYGWLGGASALCHLSDRKQSDVWEIPRPKKSPDHPTTKPIALAASAIENSSRPGDPVLDLFGGSGTTLMAAEQTGRTAFLSELDPCYADCIAERYTRFRQSDEGVFLLRDGKKYSYHAARSLS